MHVAAENSAVEPTALGYVCSEQTLKPFERSIGAMIRDRAAKLGEAPLLSDKGAGGEYRAISWSEVWHQVTNFGANLLAAGIRPGDRVAVLSENRQEMLVSELAAMSIGALSVPIFAGYLPKHIEYILRDSGARRITVSTPLQLMKLAKCSDRGQIETIVLMDYSPSELSIDSVMNLPIVPYAKLISPPAEEFRLRFNDAVDAVETDTSCLVMYTSGTTGDPKGVELSHGNLLSQQRAVQQLWEIGAQERFLSYLPWHHSFGGLFERFMALYSGASIALDESGGRDITLLIKNWREVQPTLFFSVPGVFQKLADEIKASREVRETIFHPGLRFVFTAAAPLPRDVSELFTAAGVPVLEGWGLTETSPCVTLTDPRVKRAPGVVGWPIPGVKVRVAADGEIQVAGPNVMRGYFNESPHNHEAFTPDGWFRTGDIGELSESGLRIMGRRDGVFKLLNAEKVFAAQIEMALVSGSEFIEQAVVLGSGQHYVTALLYANRKTLTDWAQRQGIKFGEGDDISAISDIRRLFAHEVQRINNEIAGRYQRVRKFVVFGESLSFEAGELTPTAKVVRNRVLANKQELVEAIYRPGCPPASTCIVCLGDCY